MKRYFQNFIKVLIAILFLFSCQKKDIETYEFYTYIGEENPEYAFGKIPNQDEILFYHFIKDKKENVNLNLYKNLSKFKYKLNKTTSKKNEIKSIINSELKSEKNYIPDHKCIGFYNNIVLYKKNDSIISISKFKNVCDEYFIYFVKDRSVKHKKLNFEKVFKK